MKVLNIKRKKNKDNLKEISTLGDDDLVVYESREDEYSKNEDKSNTKLNGRLNNIVSHSNWTFNNTV